MKRAALVATLLALGAAGMGAAYALADTPPPSTTTSTTGTAPTDTTPTSTTSTPTPPPPRQVKKARIASGVTIDGIHVGGLAYGPAYSVVAVAFRSPLELTVGTHKILVSPWKLGANPYIGPAVSRALKAKPGTAVKMLVRLDRATVAAYVDDLAGTYDRQVADAHVVLRNLTPVVVPEVEGSRLSQYQATSAIIVALQQNLRGAIALPARVTEPTVTAASFSSIIVIRRDSKHLFLYKEVDAAKPVQLVRSFVVATGQPIYPTPVGDFKIIVMERNPWWYPPPDAPWAKGAKPIPPGPGNPLGTRWMGLSAPGVGIHGTPDPASLGYSASHGCIRMFIPSAEWLFNHVQVGTPVFIVPA